MNMHYRFVAALNAVVAIDVTLLCILHMIFICYFVEFLCRTYCDVKAFSTQWFLSYYL